MPFGLDAMVDNLRQKRADAEARRNAPPDFCPIDGMALQVLDDGQRHCPMGNYTYPAGPAETRAKSLGI